jgi:hypothetical protein
MKIKKTKIKIIILITKIMKINVKMKKYKINLKKIKIQLTIKNKIIIKLIIKD